MKLDSFYDYFLILVIIAKITFVIIAIRIKYFEVTDSKSKESLSEIYKRQEIVDFFALLLIYILLLYTFFPKRKHLDIVIGHHEQIIFFALGIIGILHLDWNIPKEVWGIITGKNMDNHKSNHNSYDISTSKLN